MKQQRDQTKCSFLGILLLCVGLFFFFVALGIGGGDGEKEYK